MFQDKIKWVDKQYLEHLKRIRYEKSNKNLDFIKDLLIIKNDKFNSKEDRFRISAESFLHNLLRDIILTYNDYKYKNNE
jgi:tRNA U38,U39,U40 pseudouridine synthase TruA